MFAKCRPGCVAGGRKCYQVGWNELTYWKLCVGSLDPGRLQEQAHGRVTENGGSEG